MTGGCSSGTANRHDSLEQRDEPGEVATELIVEARKKP
jgi:hypothetical protein